MPQHVPRYDELKLRITRGGAADDYRVVAEAADGSTDEATFTVPVDATQLENFVLRVGQPRRGGTRRAPYGSRQVELAQRFGADLFEALFVGGVRDIYRRARERADSEEKGLRITLYLTGVPDLLDIPWEFLYERPMFLAHSIDTPIVRSLDLPAVREPRKVELPLRILGIDSRPDDNQPLDADRERDNLQRALEPLQADGAVELEWLARATMRELQRRLDRSDDIHVLHYIGHGDYDERSETGLLLLEDPGGSTHRVTGAELGSLLYDERALRLAVLNTCEGARTSRRDAFSGVASALVDTGIPAVIGMQFEITDDAAITLADQLYTSLAAGYPVDACLAQARRAIWADCNNTEFATPVLFLRAADARLFHVKETTVRLRSGAPREPVDGRSHPDDAPERPQSPPEPSDASRDPADTRRETGATRRAAKRRQQRKWAAKVIERQTRLLVLEIQLDRAVHTLRLEWGTWKDTLKVNGETVRTVWINPAGGHTFTLQDGDTIRSAKLTVAEKSLGWGGFRVASLRVSGRILYRE